MARVGLSFRRIRALPGASFALSLVALFSGWREWREDELRRKKKSWKLMSSESMMPCISHI